MIHLSRHLPCLCKPATNRRRLPRHRPWLLFPLAGLLLTCASCSQEADPPEKPPVPVTDTRPVGDGLKVIGYALLGGAVVIVLGSMIRH